MNVIFSSSTKPASDNADAFRVALCHHPRNLAEFSVHIQMMVRHGGFYHGSYFQNLERAIMHYKKRCNEHGLKVLNDLQEHAIDTLLAAD